MTVQGSRAANGDDRRELFTETATTTLIFDNGTVLNLRVRIAPGQSVFLRNEQSGREILCKVKEAPPEGQTGYTDLEFAQPDSEFWDPNAAAKKSLSAREKIDAAVAKLGQSREEAAPPADVAPPAVPGLPPAPPASPAQPASLETKAEAHADERTPPAQAASAPAEQLMAPSEPAPAPPISAVERPLDNAESASALATAPMQSDEVAAAPTSESQSPPQPEENTLAMMGAASENVTIPKAPATIQEQLVAAHEMVPEAEHATTVTTAPEELSVPTGEEIDAALQRMAGAPIPGASALKAQPKAAAQSAAVAVEDAPHDTPEFNEATFATKLAALLAGDARRARHAAAEREKEALRAAQAAQGEAAESEAGLAPKMTLEQRLTTGKGAWTVGISASAVILACLFLIWRAVYVPGASSPFVWPTAAQGSRNKNALAGAKPARKLTAALTIAKGPATAASSVPSNGRVATQAPSSAKPVQAVQAQAPSKLSNAAAQVARTSVTQTVKAPAEPRVSDAPSSEPVVTPVAPSEPVVIENGDANSYDAVKNSEEGPKSSRAIESASAGNLPAKIISEVQPTFPQWAKSLDVSGVVKLDAVIDEKGNLKSAKPLSGPRALQHAAQDAVTLWIFEPAQQNGKPVASHLILSVKFQR